MLIVIWVFSLLSCVVVVVSLHVQLLLSATAALSSIVKTLPNFLSSFASDIILKVRAARPVVMILCCCCCCCCCRCVILVWWGKGCRSWKLSRQKSGSYVRLIIVTHPYKECMRAMSKCLQHVQYTCSMHATCMHTTCMLSAHVLHVIYIAVRDTVVTTVDFL